MTPVRSRSTLWRTRERPRLRPRPRRRTTAATSPHPGQSDDGPDGVYRQLFGRERSGERDAMVRNEVRHVLLEEAFESVQVWLHCSHGASLRRPRPLLGSRSGSERGSNRYVTRHLYPRAHGALRACLVLHTRAEGSSHVSHHLSPRALGSPHASRHRSPSWISTSTRRAQVWLLPPPTERTADLAKELRPADCSREFRSEVRRRSRNAASSGRRGGGRVPRRRPPREPGALGSRHVASGSPLPLSSVSRSARSEQLVLVPVAPRAAFARRRRCEVNGVPRDGVCDGLPCGTRMDPFDG